MSGAGGPDPVSVLRTVEQPTFQSSPGGGRAGGGRGAEGGSRQQPLNRGVALVLICAVGDGYLGPGGGEREGGGGRVSMWMCIHYLMLTI